MPTFRTSSRHLYIARSIFVRDRSHDVTPKFAYSSRVFKATTPSPEALRRFTIDTCSEASLAAVLVVGRRRVGIMPLLLRDQFRRCSMQPALLSTYIHVHVNMQNLDGSRCNRVGEFRDLIWSGLIARALIGYGTLIGTTESPAFVGKYIKQTAPGNVQQIKRTSRVGRELIINGYFNGQLDKCYIPQRQMRLLFTKIAEMFLFCVSLHR